MQYFIKLLMLISDEPSLIFGFCAPTEEPASAWKKKIFDKKLPILQYTAILNQSKKDEIINNLNKHLTIKIDDIEHIINLASRPSVFSDTSGFEWKNNKPVSKLHIVDEYWNLDKTSLMMEIEKSFFPCNGRELRRNVQQLFETLKKECGINFAQEGGRLGNFECYTPGKYLNSFDVCGNSNTIILRKKHTVSENLIVNCATENEGRWVSDEVKIFSADLDELSFFADEPMTHYKIKVWETESGSLVYSSECAFMMEMHLNIEFAEFQKVIQDPWTETLQQNASKHNNDINKIKNITVASRYNEIKVSNEQHMLWRQAKKDGERLCSLYKTIKIKGAFVPKTVDRKGEIDSFQKVREYIEEKGIKQVVLADPFFSVKSAAKLLGRISSASVELNVVTSLASADPDTGESNTNIKEQCKIFINQNRNFLHSNLKIKNVLRGNNQAFHDRYLIRYFDDGHIDGFLLSNSLNSAGQFYPYVIAPLESEVCLEVAEYLQNLTDTKYQNSLSGKDRVQIEELCGLIMNREQIELEKKYVLPQLLTGESRTEYAVDMCVKLDYFRDGSTAESFYVLPEAFSTIIPVVIRQLVSNPEVAIIALGEMSFHTNQGMNEATNILKSIPDANSQYIEIVSLLAKEVEHRQKHEEKSIYSDQFKYWAIMNEKAMPGPVSFWVNNPGYVYYKEEGYWSCLYQLLWQISPEDFLHILESIKSPLMLSILIEYIALYDYDQYLYEVLLRSKWDWMHDLGAEWLWKNIELKNLNITSVLDSINRHMQLKQSTYILSRVAFNARMQWANASDVERTVASELCNELIGNIVRLCNASDISIDKQTNALKKIRDSEQTSNAWLILSIAESLKDKSVQNSELDRIISAYFHADHPLPCNEEKNRLYIELVVKATEIRYKDAFESHVSSKLLHWDALYEWKEPYLSDRDYWRWSNSKNIVGWDIQFLKACQELGHEITGKLKVYYDRANLT